ncbi:uncharacterized protein [Triticum aestivum]|uniref:uncharacterized protein n=1 Tax=Triticum aestivum TaxID=4565 RepID=UPI001D0294CB|nr:uncharacterized protein LOC123158204 [Triticum aestivum]
MSQAHPIKIREEACTPAARSHHQPPPLLSLPTPTRCRLDQRNWRPSLRHVPFRSRNNKHQWPLHSRRPTQVGYTSSEPSTLSFPPCRVKNTSVVALGLVTPAPLGFSLSVALPAGKLKAIATDVGRPGAGGNMHVLGPRGNWQRRPRPGLRQIQLPTGINRPIIKRFGAQLLKKA